MSKLCDYTVQIRTTRMYHVRGLLTAKRITARWLLVAALCTTSVWPLARQCCCLPQGPNTDDTVEHALEFPPCHQEAPAVPKPSQNRCHDDAGDENHPGHAKPHFLCGCGVDREMSRPVVSSAIEQTVRQGWAPFSGFTRDHVITPIDVGAVDRIESQIAPPRLPAAPLYITGRSLLI